VVIATAVALLIQEYQFPDVELPLLVLVIGLVMPRDERLVRPLREWPIGSDSSKRSAQRTANTLR
jgi:hypothetical protein